MCTRGAAFDYRGPSQYSVRFRTNIKVSNASTKASDSCRRQYIWHKLVCMLIIIHKNRCIFPVERAFNNLVSISSYAALLLSLARPLQLIMMMTMKHAEGDAGEELQTRSCCGSRRMIVIPQFMMRFRKIKPTAHMMQVTACTMESLISRIATLITLLLRFRLNTGRTSTKHLTRT